MQSTYEHRKTAANQNINTNTVSKTSKSLAQKPGKPIKDIISIPADIQQILKEAMKKEEVSNDQYESLAWLIFHESNGKVDNKNKESSARGLFQLTKASYHFNPNGEKSFGIAIEECQGGIRYIKNRYGTSEKAVEFWKKHRWY